MENALDFLVHFISFVKFVSYVLYRFMSNYNINIINFTASYFIFMLFYKFLI